MPYTIDDWKERVRYRSDLSSYLFHLTKENDENSAIDVLIKILSEKKLIGSDVEKGFIVGNNPAVCFQDVPLYSLCQNTFHEKKYREKLGGKIRYRPIGLGFKKNYIFNKGGRPVIYERTIKAKEFLPEDQWWRIVNIDLGNAKSIIDWSHEKEWRVKGDMNFNLSETYVILVNKKAYKKFVNKVEPTIIKEIAGIIVLDPILT